MGPARTEHPLCILLLLDSAVAGAAYPQPTELQLYGRHGSDILIPGAGMELQGDGLLEWHVKKPGDQERQWILTYHYGSKEPEMSAKYEHRVVFSMKNASLKLLNLTRQDDGLYILEMNSLYNQDEKHVPVRVLEPISDIKVMKCKSSGDYGVRLMCEASGDVWNLTWWHNGRQLVQNITHDGNTSVLDIKEVGTGSYNCVAWNPISELEASFQVAQKSIMILYLVGLLTAAVVFSLLYLTQLFLCLMCSYRCPEQSVRVFQRAAFVCWFLFLICALVSAVVRQAASVSYAFPELNLLFLVVLTVCFTIELFSLSDRKCLKKDGKRQDNQDPTLDRKKSSYKVNGIQDMDKESKKALRAVQSIVQSRLDSNSSRGGNSETAEEPSDGDPEPLNEPEGDDTSKGDILPETPDPTLDKKKSSVKVNGIQDMAKQSKKTLRGVLDKLLLLLRLAALLVSWVTLLVYFIYDCHAYKKTAHFELTISLAVVVPTVLFILTCWCCCPNGPIGRWLDRPCKDRVMKKPTKDLELGGLPDNVPGGEVTYSPVMSSDSVGT